MIEVASVEDEVEVIVEVAGDEEAEVRLANAAWISEACKRVFLDHLLSFPLPGGFGDRGGRGGGDRGGSRGGRGAGRGAPRGGRGAARGGRGGAKGGSKTIIVCIPTMVPPVGI